MIQYGTIHTQQTSDGEAQLNPGPPGQQRKSPEIAVESNAEGDGWFDCTPSPREGDLRRSDIFPVFEIPFPSSELGVFPQAVSGLWGFPASAPFRAGKEEEKSLSLSLSAQD